MPIYDFKCDECGTVAEVFLREGDPSKARCPNCGGSAMRKLFSSFNTISGGPNTGGTTCCGREERCGEPPCSDDGGCRRK
jgi:putative FmdB family regulatory protein